MLAGRGCDAMANTGRSYAHQASLGMEGIMGGLMMWWCGRRLTPRKQRRQEGHSYAAGIWRLHGIAVGLSSLMFTLVTTAASGQEPSQRLTITPSLSIGERYDDNIFETQTNKQHDFITVLSPGIHVQYLSPTPTLGTPFLLPIFESGRRAPELLLEPTPAPPLDLDYHAAFQFFHNNSNQNNVAHRLALTAAWPLAPSLQGRLRELLLVTEDPLGRDERLSDPTGLRPVSQQQPARTIRNKAEGRADVRLGGRRILREKFGRVVDDVRV